MSRANHRRDKNSPAHELMLEDANGFPLCRVTIREARQGVKDGIYEPFYERGYKMGTRVEDRELTKVRLTSTRIPSLRPIVPITRGEAAAFAGLHGESRTMSMTEAQKRRRVQKIRDERNTIVPMEDNIERAIGKITLYPMECDTKSVRTGPLPDAAAIQFAEQLSGI